MKVASMVSLIRTRDSKMSNVLRCVMNFAIKSLTLFSSGSAIKQCMANNTPPICYMPKYTALIAEEASIYQCMEPVVQCPWQCRVASHHLKDISATDTKFHRVKHKMLGHCNTNVVIYAGFAIFIISCALISFAARVASTS